MKPAYVIWDWNGTLLDDAQTCVDTMNAMLSRRGLPLLTMARYREIFTFPVEDYYRAAGFDFAKEPFPLLAEEYIRPYNQAAAACGLCPGAEEALERLKAWGVGQAVASASHQEALEEQVKALGIEGYFDALLGIQDALGAGKAGVAQRYLQARCLSPGQVWCVGDTLHDWEVAAKMGCRCVLVAQGHQSAGRLAQCPAPVLPSLLDLPAFFQSQENP